MATLKFVNGRGIPCIESTGVALTTTAAVFSFDPYRMGNLPFAGLIAVKIRPQDTFTAPATAVPVQFATTGVASSNVTLQGRNGAAVDTAAWEGTGIYLVFFDPDTNQLHLIG